jgi:hypothetical protein
MYHRKSYINQLKTFMQMRTKQKLDENGCENAGRNEN